MTHPDQSAGGQYDSQIGHNGGIRLVGARLNLPKIGLPHAPLGQRLVLTDGRGAFRDPTIEGGRGGWLTWRFYHLVDCRTYHLTLTTDTASSANASRFRVAVAARWRIDAPAEYLPSMLDPAPYCTSMIKTILSDITRSVEPTHANLAQEMVDRVRYIGYTVGHGIVVWFDNFTVSPPEGLENLQTEIELGRTQVDVDRLRRARNNAERVNDLDFEAASTETDRSVRRGRGEDWMASSEDNPRRALRGRRARAELTEAEDRVFDD